MAVNPLTIIMQAIAGGGAPQQQGGAPVNAPAPAYLQQAPAPMATQGPGSDQSTAGGTVLARLKRKDDDGVSGMGSGAVNAIKLAKGKSKWGAIAAGLAAGLQAQEAAKVRNMQLAAQRMKQMFGQDMALQKMDQGEMGLDLREQQIEAQKAANIARISGQQKARQNTADYRNKRLDILKKGKPSSPTKKLADLELSRKRAWDRFSSKNIKYKDDPKPDEIEKRNAEFENWQKKYDPEYKKMVKEQKVEPVAAPNDSISMALPRANNAAELSKIPAGAQFIGADGKSYRKPKNGI